MTEIEEGNKRLLNLARVLSKVDEQHAKKGERGYNQETFRHPCGVPACALGHYIYTKRGKETGFYTVTSSSYAIEEFALDLTGYMQLFSSWGCGNAQSGKAAAAFIRKFVKERKQLEAWA